MEKSDFIFENEDLSDKSFSELLEGSFLSCKFGVSSFTNAHLRDVIFKKCVFDEISFKNCRLQNITFENCSFRNVNFSMVDPSFFSIKLLSCSLIYCNFSDLLMKKTSFRGSCLKECFFTNTKLSESDFRSADLNGTLFHNSDLSKSDFTGAFNYSIDFNTNNIKKCVFSHPEVLKLLSYLDIIIK